MCYKVVPLNLGEICIYENYVAKLRKPFKNVYDYHFFKRKSMENWKGLVKKIIQF